MKLENKVIEATLGENLPKIVIEKEEDFKELLEKSDIIFHEQKTEDISDFVEFEEDLEESEEDEEDNENIGASFPNLRRPTEIDSFKIKVAKENNIAESLFKKYNDIYNKAIDKQNEKIKLQKEEKEEIQKLFKSEIAKEEFEILAYDVYSFVKDGISYIFEEPIDKYLKLQEIKEKYEKLKNDSISNDNSWEIRSKLREVKDSIIQEVNKWYQNNRKQIEEELEEVIVCKEFCSCSTKGTRSNYFQNNINDIKFFCYPYLQDALEAIYKKHKNDFK